VSIVASAPLAGTPPDQFPALNQSVEVEPVQSVAKDGLASPKPSVTIEVVLTSTRLTRQVVAGIILNLFETFPARSAGQHDFDWVSAANSVRAP